MARRKIALIGSGNIGGTLAHLCALRGLGDCVLFDVVEGLPQGKALDLWECGPIAGFDASIKGTNRIQDIAGAAVCVITAGASRKPGMSRDDLLAINARVVGEVCRGIKRFAPDAFVIVVTNPLDAMVTHALRVTGFPKARVVGQAGILDSARYRAFVAAELAVSPHSVRAMVLGGHGDDMVPVRSYCQLAGVPVARLISPERLDAIENRVRHAGGEILGHMKTGAFYSTAHAVIRMVEAYLFDRKEILPCAALLEGEYGVKGFYVGVPVQIGAGGVERVIEVDLSESERRALDASVRHVRELVEALERIA